MGNVNSILMKEKISINIFSFRSNFIEAIGFLLFWAMCGKVQGCITLNGQKD